MSIILAGFLIGLSLIVAIGPQNALVIKQGVKRQGVIPVVAVCIASEFLLLYAGTIGVGALVEQAPTALTVLKYLGAAYIAWFAFTCFRDAYIGTSLTIGEIAEEPTHWLKPILAALAFTWLNPAAYVDVIVMLGGMANQYGPDGRWYFAAGALSAALIWFPVLALASTRFSVQLQKPLAWRIVNITVGVIMLVLCARLLMH